MYIEIRPNSQQKRKPMLFSSQPIRRQRVVALLLLQRLDEVIKLRLTACVIVRLFGDDSHLMHNNNNETMRKNGKKGR